MKSGANEVVYCSLISYVVEASVCTQFVCRQSINDVMDGILWEGDRGTLRLQMTRNLQIEVLYEDVLCH